MDIISVISGLLVMGIGAFSGGFICNLVVTGYGVAQLEKRIKSLEMQDKSVKGNIAREEYAEEETQVMLEAAAVLKNTEMEQKEKIQQLLALAAKHPRTAKKLIQQFGLAKKLF